jgi:hypothetical protein
MLIDQTKVPHLFINVQLTVPPQQVVKLISTDNSPNHFGRSAIHCHSNQKAKRQSAQCGCRSEKFHHLPELLIFQDLVLLSHVRLNKVSLVILVGSPATFFPIAHVNHQNKRRVFGLIHVSPNVWCHFAVKTDRCFHSCSGPMILLTGFQSRQDSCTHCAILLLPQRQLEDT